MQQTVQNAKQYRLAVIVVMFAVLLSSNYITSDF